MGKAQSIVQTKEKTFEAKWKDGMYGQTKSHAPTLGPIKTSTCVM